MINTQEFFKILWQGIPSGYVDLRLIPEASSGAHDIYRPVDVMQSFPDTGLDYLHEQNHTHHIYFRVTVSHNAADGKRNIAYVPALWCDLDNTDDYQPLLDLTNYPNLIVRSGGGYHAYWLLSEPLRLQGDDFQLVEQVNHGLAITCKGDEACRNVNRILRVPGFLNIKAKYGEPKPLCEVVHYDDARYTWQFLVRVYAKLAAPPKPQIKRHIPPEAFSKQLPNRVKNYLQSGASVGGRNQELFYCARAYNDAGYSQSEAERDLVPRATTDGLRESEALTAIASAYKYTANPAQQLPRHMSQFMAIEDTLKGVQ